MKVNDAISGGFFILLASAIFYFTNDFRVMPGQNYGAAFFPRTIATIMGLLGLALVVQGLKSRTEPWIQALDWVRSPRHIANFALIVGVLIFYIVASNTLGFLITGFICLFALLIWLRGPAHWLASLLTTIGFVLLLQFFFGQFLRVPLPWGLLQDYAW